MRVATLLAVLLAAPALAQPQTTLYPGQSGTGLLNAVRSAYTPAQTLGYNNGRDVLYQHEQDTHGEVCGVYTRFCVQLTPGQDPSTDAYHKGINAEHTWPQSYGAGSEPAKSDLHHLFPAKDNVNSSRGNHPYAEVPDAEATAWYREGQSQSFAPTVAVDEWSERASGHPDPAFSARFEPREDHAGNAARAVFYFRAIYDAEVQAAGAQAFFDVQAPDLIVWHYEDPVDLAEYARSEWVATLQGTPNPFVLDSTLARRAFGLSGVPGGGGGPGGGTGSAGPLWVNEVHYDNDGADTGEGVEVAGPAGTDLTGWTLALYNGSGGAVYQTLSLSGAVPDQQGGHGTVWVAVSGLQNGSSDGLALVDPTGAVVQFLSYEGTLTASGGPASGTNSTDLGVAETSSTPVGWSLQVGGTGSAAGDFAWEGPQAATPGAPNANQTFVGGSGPAPEAWVNEVHYDNSGGDTDEGVEVAGTAGLDLAGWSVALYNGSNGTVYDTVALSGTIDDEGAGVGALWFARSGVQNGAPDGLALVDDGGAVVQFLSDEGTLTAADGPAAGMTSDDLGVAETSGTPTGYSLQLTGTGSSYADFSWAGPQAHTRGSVNAGQTFTTPGSRQAVAAEGRPVADDAGAGLDVAVYPNPATGPVTVAVELAAPAEVRAEVYDALGRRVAAADARLGAGFGSVPVDLTGLPAGVYVVRVAAGEAIASRVVTVAR